MTATYVHDNSSVMKFKSHTYVCDVQNDDKGGEDELNDTNQLPLTDSTVEEEASVSVFVYSVIHKKRLSIVHIYYICVILYEQKFSRY